MGGKVSNAASLRQPLRGSFNEDLLAALNTADALAAAPRDFAWLLDAMGGLALEHVDRIAVARLSDIGG